jgi:uncharacterized repeat protein (TIGR04052 family)
LKAFLSIISAISVVLVSACGNGSHSTVSEPLNFELRFNAVSGSESVNCEQVLHQLGSTSANASLLDFSVFIHGLKFIRADGSSIAANLISNEWQSRNVALLDFQDKSDSCSGAIKPTNKTIQGSIATKEDFIAIEFTLGIPPELNHVDPSSVEAPLNASNMFWSWQSGYKSMRIDLSPEGGIQRPGDPDFLGTNYFFHLGSTGCSGDPIRGEAVKCARVNQPVIRLNGFNIESNAIKIDVARLVSGLNIRSDVADSPGCMSSEFDTECGVFFDNLGLNLNSGLSSPSALQTVFSVQ